ncbi:hypothetical protein [Devosia alba]|uniref:hypothetical protein n=1 Tax=Devosia alba TaxID=3152360 RepID=UPI0032669712
MARIIQFQGRTIQVPDGASDEQVRQILQAQPQTPEQERALALGRARRRREEATTSATASSAAYTDALAAGSAASQKFNTPEASAEPGFMDNVMGALGYAGSTAAIAGDRFGEGMANVAGLPIDAANFTIEMGMRGADTILPGDQSWLKTSPNPIGGSENLNDARTLFGTTDYEAPQPQDPFQKVVGRVAEEVGASSLPVVGLAAKGSQMGAKVAREAANPLVRTFVAPAAAAPSKFVAAETAGATAAGLGASFANMFVDRDTQQGQVADMVGALGGAGVYGIGSTLAKGLGHAFNAIRQNPNYVDQVVKDAVVDRIGKAGGLDGTDGPMDTDALLDAITRSDTTRPSDIIPGFEESLADTTQNPGLASLEYSRQSGPNSGMFTTRRSTNNEAVDQVMEAIAPQQTPGAFRSELETQRDLRLSAAAEGTQNAQSEFDQYIANLSPRMAAEERGATIREGLTNANRSAREVESNAWQGLDGQVDPNPLADMLDETRGGLTTARRQATADLDPTVDIPRQLSGTADEPVTETQLREVLDMRSKLLDEQRAATSGERPDRNRANAIGTLLDDVNAYLDSDAVDPALRAQIDDAKSVSRGVNEQFNRPNDPIAQTLARSEGRPDLPDSAVGPRFVQPDTKQASNIDRLLAATDMTSHGGSVREAVKDEILGGIQRQGTTPVRLQQYLDQFTRAFDRFPDLRADVEAAAVAGGRLTDRTEAQTALTRDLGNSDGTVSGKGPVGRYLQYSDANAERAVSEVLSAKDPAAAADELLTFIGDNPSAVEGARSAFWQKLRTESQSAERSMNGPRMWRGDWLKSFLDKPATAAVAERLYRDNPEHLADIRAIADVLDNTDLRVRARAPASSGTAQSVNQVLTPETLQSRFYAYMRGQVSGTYLVTSIAAVVARRAVRGAQTDAIERMTDKALLNPEFAAELLKENNPANRTAMARKVRAWLGNEASTFINLMDAEDDPEEAAPNIEDRTQPDELMDAVTR